jgi:hypothetical protein
MGLDGDELDQGTIGDFDLLVMDHHEHHRAH